MTENELNVMAQYLAATENFIRFHASPKYKQLQKGIDYNDIVYGWFNTLKAKHTQA
jgi:hypothetical protein